MKKHNTEMEEALEEIREFYKGWLTASGMTEEDFLGYRTCRCFRVRLEDRIDGFAVQLIHGAEEEPIGKPFFIYFANSEDEKRQFFENTPLILYYLAGRLDLENTKNPIHGSYGPEYFKDRVRKKLPAILKRQEEVLETGWNV